jgi:melanoma-associated antigen
MTVDLRAHLKRLRLDSGTNIPYSTHATQQSQTVDAFLSQCQRQGYVERSRMGDAQGGTNKAGGGKRGRAAAAKQGGAEDAQYEWRWGPRASAEIGELGIARFVADFMVERKQHDGRVTEDEDEDDDPRARREREKKRQAEAKSKLSKVMTSIERSAGGALSDVR